MLLSQVSPVQEMAHPPTQAFWAESCPFKLHTLHIQHLVYQQVLLDSTSTVYLSLIPSLATAATLLVWAAFIPCLDYASCFLMALWVSTLTCL